MSSARGKDSSGKVILPLSERRRLLNELCCILRDTPGDAETRYRPVPRLVCS